MSGQAAMTRRDMPIATDSSGYVMCAEDYEFLNIDHVSARLCFERRAPLGIPGADFPHFVSDLENALEMQGFTDADVRIQGSSVRFFSGAHKPFPQTPPSRAQLFLAEFRRLWQTVEMDAIESRIQKQWPAKLPGQRPFDSMYRIGLSPEASDIDIQISSYRALALARRIAEHRHIDPNELQFQEHSYNFLIKEIADVEFLYLARWVTQWQERLDRGIAIAIFDGDGPPVSNGALSSHFQEEDWVILQREADGNE